jgi:hypothetical protein
MHEFEDECTWDFGESQKKSDHRHQWEDNIEMEFIEDKMGAVWTGLI